MNLIYCEVRYRAVLPGLYHFLRTRSKHFPQRRAPESPNLVGGLQLEGGSRQCKTPLFQKFILIKPDLKILSGTQQQRGASTTYASM